jgi:hypothetical protein
MRKSTGALSAVLCSAVVACSSGGGGRSDGPASGNRTLSGTITYDKVPTSADGLDFAGVVRKPVRGATVELLDGMTVIATTQSTASGQYSFTWPASGPAHVRVRVRAETTVPSLRVEDNTAGDALYAMVSPQIDAGAQSALSLNAPSGWGGSSYTSARVAAPFAVLDTAYTVAKAFTAERPVTFPALKINWSVNNRPEDGEKRLGQISTSHWDRSELYILGKEDVDTDEFDSMIIAHEWGHYFESKLSRSDSPGGSHGVGQFKDPRLSWGEGWATALGAITLAPDVYYTDTFGPQESTSGIHYSIEDNAAEDPSPGWYSEMSVVHVFYDLWDPASGAEPFDGVSLSLGALYDVMVGAQKDTAAFTTIFSFVDGLRAAHPSRAAAIDTLLSHRGVAAPVADEFGSTETNDAGFPDLLPIYSGIAVNGPAIPLWFITDPDFGNALAANRFAGFYGTGGAVSIALTSTRHVGMTLYAQGVELAFTENGGSGSATLNGATTTDVLYTLVVTGFDASDPPVVYSAALGVTSL